jgi:putative phosphoesterase
LIDDSKDKILIGLISDTHIPSRGGEIPKVIIDDFLKNNVDYVVHLGDFTKYEVYEYLQNTFGKEKVIGIRGNMDDSKINKELPDRLELTAYGYNILLLHGWGGPNMVIRRLKKHIDLSKYHIIIFGHIHTPLTEKVDNQYFINPGTPTDKRFTDINSYGFLSLSRGKIEPRIVYL